MKVKSYSPFLSLALSLFLSPLSQAAGMIVIDPINGALPIITPPHPRPGHPPIVRPIPILKGQVSFGLRLQDADIKVEINDQVAKTYICQTFVNDTDRNLAGTYLFPLPEDTTFSSFSLHIDGKPVEGKILEAQEARNQYEEIVRRMVDPGLLEYADYKTVRARIFPIPAHGTKKVELEYTQLLKAENGLLKYSFPLKTEGNSSEADELKVSVKLNSKQGIRTIWSPSHIISSKRDGANKALVSFLGKDIIPDKDFVLYYSVSDKDMSASLLTRKESSEDGYFLLTLTPPVESKQIVSKDIVFVADTSGSMRGERMEQNKNALKYLVNALNPNDKFSIVQFNTDADAFKTSLISANAENKKAAISFIDDLEASGGTNIADALKTASAMLGTNKERPSFLVLMTDGEPTVGETTVTGLLKTIDTKKDIRVFDFGVGYDVNTKLLNKLADDNHGTSQYIEPNESMEVALSSFYEKIKSPVLSNIKLSYDGIQVKDVYPKVPKDIFAGSQLMLLGKYKGSGNAVVHLNGTVNGQAKAYNFPLKFEEQSLGHSYLPRLWAMRRIAHLTEVAQNNSENREIIDEIILLSKKYGIISAYTSFLVTDPSEGNNRVVNGPLPTPIPLGMPESFGGAWRRQGGGGGGNGLGDLRAPVSAKAAFPRREMAYSSGAPAGSLSRLKNNSAPLAPSVAQAFPGRKSDESFSSYLSADSLALPETGKLAVKKAKQLAQLKDVVSFESESKEQQGTKNVKNVDDKTFYLQSDIWVDSTYDSHKSPKLETIVFGSKEYFELLKLNSGIAKYLAVGRQLILVYKGHTYKIIYKA